VGTGCAAGAVGAAASAAFSPDFISGIDPSGAPLDQGQLAVLAAFATAMGGGSAALTGLNVQGATSAAQNEALNNDAGSPGHTAAAVKNGGVAGAAWNLAVVAAGLADQGGAWLVNQFALVANGNRQQQPPSDPNKQLESNDGNDTPSGTAGAVVTPSISVPLPGGAMATIPPVVVPGAPIMSSGGAGNDSEVASTGQRSATSPATNREATSPVGVSGSPMTVPRGTNAPTTINDVNYSAHAIDRMQGRGIPPSVVQNTIQNGTVYPTGAGTTGHYDSVNNVRVITNSTTGLVVTVIPGAPGK
jgi:filamentous hemagglutinin